jgi:hypothetical protein
MELANIKKVEKYEKKILKLFFSFELINFKISFIDFGVLCEDGQIPKPLIRI